MFTKRHEQELAEIKALTFELGQRFEEVLKQLERIKENQDQLATQHQPPAGEDQPASTGRRKAGRTKASAADGGPAAAEVVGSKKGRGQVATPVEGGGGKPRKGRGGRKRRASEPGPSPEADDE